MMMLAICFDRMLAQDFRTHSPLGHLAMHYKISITLMKPIGVSYRHIEQGKRNRNGTIFTLQANKDFC